MLNLNPTAANGRRLPRHARPVLLVTDTGNAHFFGTVQAAADFLGVTLQYVSTCLCDPKPRKIHGFLVKDAKEELQVAAN